MQLAVIVLMIALAAAFVVSSGHPVHVPAPLSGPARNGLIAFDADGQIVIQNADGSGRRTLTADTATHTTPIWSPDGTRLAFWTSTAGGPLSLTVVDAEGGNPRVVTGASRFSVASTGSQSASWPSAADWSPDGSRLAFSAIVDRVSRIVVVTLDGREPTLIGDPTLEAQSPVWSPDGTRIAFAGGRYPTSALYVINADGSSAPIRLTHLAGDVDSFIAAGWSPDGTRLVYEAGVNSFNQFIWIVNADGSNEHAFDSPDRGRILVDNQWPAWSPDGRKIVFVRTDDGSAVIGPQLFVMNADGSGLEGLTTPQIDDGPPAWSPDGTRIVATTLAYEHAGFLVVDPSGVAPPLYLAATAHGGAWSSWERLALNP
jgi:TolB protein